MGLFRKTGAGAYDGRIESLELTTKPFGDKTSDAYGEQLYAVFQIQPEGSSDKPRMEPVKIGKAEDYEIDSDRPYWLSTTNSDVLHPSSQMGKLIASMVEVGVSPETFVESDDAQEADFSALVGARFRFIRKDDPEMTEKFGKKKFTRKDGTKGEADRRYFAVSAVYELGGEDNAPTPAKKTVTVAQGGKPNGKAVQVTAEQVVDETITGILQTSPGKKLQRSKLAAKVALTLGKGHTFAKRAQELVNDEEFLAACNGFTYDSDSQQLSL